MKQTILGDDMQAVVLDLAAGEMVRAEAGAMMMMTQSIKMDSQLNTGSGGGLMGGLMSGLKRVVSGDSLFVTTFTAQGGPGQVIFSGPYPGKIIPLDLSETGEMLCQRDSYLCSDMNVDISVAFTRRLGAGLFGGEGFILQKLVGSGQAFIHAGGTIVPMDLAAGETVSVDTGCLVAFQSSVDYDIRMIKGVKSMIFGGEGLFLAHLAGPGRVYLQTLPFSRLADRIMTAAAGTGNTEQSGGLGGNLFGNILSGE